ncbi:MAG: hypothetical protein HON53_03915 [Planctomycetaceae bacterium]|nr:hypothetical protein [Planctomycetaceae bacterium]MBT6154844.1 hypothetical protein [Planctomycetaceae bacterium]MBT6486711.1 hypothetical protein [Planctomycetaceae bacterium]MBT6494058.1 hypothetical protein [Planctomycetaceae bacterium]
MPRAVQQDVLRNRRADGGGERLTDIGFDLVAAGSDAAIILRPWKLDGVSYGQPEEGNEFPTPKGMGPMGRVENIQPIQSP